MRITFDRGKRDRTLAERGLAFDDAAAVFGGTQVTIVDERRMYGESRYLTYGFLADRMVAVVWTPRDGSRRIISMRYANERERERFGRALG